MSKPMYALFSYATSVHAIYGSIDGSRFISDRPHDAGDDGEWRSDCSCGPVVFWDSAAAPLPLYEHRNVQGQLSPDEAKTH